MRFWMNGMVVGMDESQGRMADQLLFPFVAQHPDDALADEQYPLWILDENTVRYLLDDRLEIFLRISLGFIRLFCPRYRGRKS